jgi:hypothetical protein
MVTFSALHNSRGNAETFNAFCWLAAQHFQEVEIIVTCTLALKRTSSVQLNGRQSFREVAQFVKQHLPKQLADEILLHLMN